MVCPFEIMPHITSACSYNSPCTSDKEEGELGDSCSPAGLLFATLQMVEVWPTGLLHKPLQLLFVFDLPDGIYTGRPKSIEWNL
jgi:hypothetical protein